MRSTAIELRSSEVRHKAGRRAPWKDHLRSRSEPTARVIGFFGLFGVGNIGNEASLSSAMLASRRLDPSAELVCVCADPDVVRLEHGMSAAHIRMVDLLPCTPLGPRPLRIVQWPVYELARWISAYRFVRGVDLIMVPGTGILDDFGCGPKEMPYQLFRWSLSAWLARKPFALLSVGAGPITHPVSRFLMKSAVRFSSYCSYRDGGSHSYMTGIGASTLDHPVAPDIVFALPRPDASPPSAGKTIGLGVMSYHGWANDPTTGAETFRRYIEKLSTIACRILDEGSVIRILTGEKSDKRGVDALVESIRRQRGSSVETDRLISEPIESIDDLLAQIGATDGVIATRYHNVVGALMMNRPVVAVGYAAKFGDLMAGMGLGRYCHDVDAFSPETVLEDLAELMGNWEEFSCAVDAGNRRNIEMLGRQFDAVVGNMASGPGMSAVR